MAIEVTMPQMGADMTEGTLVRWIKHVGDQVNRGEILAEIETDKATVELEAFESGILRKIAVNEGETVPVGELIALLGTADEPIDASPAAAAPAAGPPASRRAAAAAASGLEAPAAPAAAPAAPPEDIGRIRISPVARRIAGDAGLDIRNVRGTGPDGRILRRDVEEALHGAPPAAAPTPAAPPAATPAPATAAPAPPAPAAAAPPPAPVAAAPRAAPVAGVQPLSRMRQAIARRMLQSKQTQPHYYLTVDVDMTAALEFRQQLNASATAEQKVSINDLVVKACALAILRHPKFNAEFGENGLTFHDQINIDIGVALDEGLIAPAILDCGSKTLGRIAQDAKDVIERAKSGRLRADEYTAGTFTITNLGAYGVEMLIGIINPPQAAILGVGSVMAQPAVRDGQVVPRQLMKIALSGDHRVSDGAEGARFIKEIQNLLENPVSLAL